MRDYILTGVQGDEWSLVMGLLWLNFSGIDHFFLRGAMKRMFGGMVEDAC
jgi:hypothetical protein